MLVLAFWEAVLNTVPYPYCEFVLFPFLCSIWFWLYLVSSSVDNSKCRTLEVFRRFRKSLDILYILVFVLPGCLSCLRRDTLELKMETFHRSSWTARWWPTETRLTSTQNTGKLLSKALSEAMLIEKTILLITNKWGVLLPDPTSAIGLALAQPAGDWFSHPPRYNVDSCLFTTLRDLLCCQAASDPT